MKPGEIRVERASRRFRVNPEPVRTLKELVLRRGRAPAAEVWAVRDVSLAVEPGDAVGLVGRNGSGKTTLLSLIAGIIAPTSGRVEAGGRVASLLELGAGFHPDFSGRENVYLNGSLYGLKRKTIDERFDEIVAFAELERFIDLPVRTYSSGMHMRLGFAIAVHVDADILLLDEVFAVGDEAFQRKCVAKVLEFKERGGTVCFVSHSAPAVERLCERAVLLTTGEVEYDGPASEALKRYHSLLALEESPEELGAGLREWGTGEVRVTGVELAGADGLPRSQFVSGEPVTIMLRLLGEKPVEPPLLSLEIRDSEGSLLGASRRDLHELGWDGSPGERELRFAIERLPLGEGEFQLSVTLANAEGTLRYHRVDSALRFEVAPVDGGEGMVRIDGDWTLTDAGEKVEAG